MKSKRSNRFLSVLQRFFSTAAVVISFFGAAHAATRYWDGAASTVNNLSDNTTTTAQNWLSGGNWDNNTTSAPVAAWTAGDAAVFGGSAASQTITAGTLTVGGLTFGQGGDGSGNSGTAYTISGGTITLSNSTITANTNATITSLLTGSTGLIKAGSGKLTLTGGNNYSGGTTVSAGTLQIGSSATNPTMGSGTYSIPAGSTLRIEYATTNSSATSLGNLTWANFSGAGTLNIAANGVFDYIASDAAIPAGFTGTLRIDGGRVQTPASGGLGGTSKVIVNPGGHFAMWNNTTTFGSGVAFEIGGSGYGEGTVEAALRMANGGATGTISGPVTLTSNATIGAGGIGVINGVISGAFNFTSGTTYLNGTMELGAANTHSGLTTVAYGTLLLAHQNALQNSTLSGNSGTVSFKSPGAAFTLGGLEGNRNLALSNTTSAAVTLTIGNNNTDSTYGGTLSGVGSLVKTGSGISRLTGSTTYSGTTTLSSGTLQVPTIPAANTTGACTMADGTTLIVAGNSAQSWRTTSLTAGVSTGATLSFQSVTPTTAAPILVTTALAANGTVTVKTSAPYTIGACTLIQYPAGGSIGGTGFGAFVLDTLPPGIQATLVNDSANGKIILNVTAVDQFVWQGTPGSIWDAGSTTSWTLAGLPATFQAGGMALLDDTASGPTTVAIAGSVVPTSVSVNNTTKDYTFSGSGAITGSSVLVKSGSGKLTVTNANTYTGLTTVNAGTLQIGDGTVDGSIAGPIASNANITFKTAGNPTYSGTLSGGGAGTFVTKEGSGTLTLTGANSFSGTTAVNEGTLRLGNGTTNGTFATGSYSVASGQRLLIDNATAVNTAGLASKLSGSGLVELNTAQSVNGSANWGPNGAAATAFGSGFTGTLQINRGRIDLNPSATGVGGMTKMVIKDGAQFLGWAGTYPASLALDIAGNGWGETGVPGALRLAGGQIGTWSGPITLTANAGILSQDGGSSFTLTGSITGPYECNFIRNGNITVAPASLTQNSYASTRIGSSGGSGIVSAGNEFAFSTGPLTMDGGTLALNGFNHTFASLSGSSGEIRNNHASNASILAVGGDGTSSTYGGSIINGAAGTLSLVKNGAGTLIVTGNAGYTGDTTVNGGLLQVPAGTASRGICTVASGTQLVVTGAPGTQWKSSELNLGANSALTIRNFHSDATTPPVDAVTAMTTAGTVTVNIPSGTFTTGTFPLIWYPSGGSIGGAGYPALTLGSLPRGVVATLQDNAANFEVDLNVTAVNPVKWKGNVNSTWDINTTQNWTIASSPDVYVEGDTLLFDDTASVFSVLPSVNVAPGSVTFDNTTNNYTLSGATGVVTGTSTLTKTGTAKLTVTGAHTYTGMTTVSGGTLELGDGTTLGTLAGSITNNSNVTINHSLPQTMAAGMSGTGSVTKNGSGTLTVSTTAVHTYAGGTTVNGGLVQMFGANNGNSSAGTGTLTVNAGATVEANSHNVLGNAGLTALSPLVLNGGTFLSDQYTHINSITMTAGTIGVRSGISQVDGMDIRTRNTVLPSISTFASATPSTISSKVTLRNDTTVTVEDGAATSDLVISGEMVSTGAMVKGGAGTLTLTGPLAGSPAVPTSNSSFSGNITLNAGKLVGAAVRTGTNTAFGSASNTRTITANAGTTLEFQAPNIFGNHNAITVPTLVVNNATVTNSDPLATGKINNALRNVTLTNGVLNATVGNGTSVINATTRPGEGYGCWGLNGTVISSGTSVISCSATGMAGRVLLGSQGADTIINVVDGTLTVSAPLQAGDAGTLGGLQKTGAGKLLLSAANIYSSPTTVTAGTLELTGSLQAASGVTTPSNITVASGATLMGTGNAAGTLAANGIIAPGSSIGTLGTGSTTFGATGSLTAEINSSTLTADKLAITGALNINPAATLTVTDLGSGTPPSGKLVIVSYTGTWNGGTFAGRPDDSVVTVNGNNYTLNYNDTDAGVNAVTLSIGADPFVTWASSFSLTGPNATKGADPDGDGVKNILEFATASNPTSASSVPRVYPLMFTIGADNALTFTTAVRKTAVFAAAGNKQTATKDKLLYTVEASNDLVNWTAVQVTEVTGTDKTNIQSALGSKLSAPPLGADWEWHTFRTDAGAQVDPSDHIRLQVTEAP